MNNVDTMYWHENRSFTELSKNTKKQKYDYVMLFFLDSKGRNKPQVHLSLLKETRSRGVREMAQRLKGTDCNS